MNSHPMDLLRSTHGLEESLSAVDEQLTRAEKQITAMLKTVKGLRKAAKEGAVASLLNGIAAAQTDLARAAEPLAKAAEALDYDVAAAFANGAWLEELALAAKNAGVVLVQRDGRVTAYPIALRLNVQAQGVRLGRKLEKRIRPSFVAAQLKALQQRPERFNARQFLDRLFALYSSRARAEEPAWRPTRPGHGPLVPLSELHSQLTLLPAAAADYPQEEFVTDLLRLDRQPDAAGTQGHRFELRGSTGLKGSKHLTMFDETGKQHDYYAIRFILEPAHGRSDEHAAATG